MNSQFPIIVSHRLSTVTIVGESVTRKRPKLHEFVAPTFGRHSAKFVSHNVSRTLFGFAFVPWRGRWHGKGISFINTLRIVVR